MNVSRYNQYLNIVLALESGHKGSNAHVPSGVQALITDIVFWTVEGVPEGNWLTKLHLEKWL